MIHNFIGIKTRQDSFSFFVRVETLTETGNQILRLPTLPKSD